MKSTQTDEIAAIKAAIREKRREMRAEGIRRVSCFNGRLTSAEYSANAELFRLNTQLKQAERGRICPDLSGFVRICPDRTHNPGHP